MTRLNKQAYTDLINEDIAFLEDVVPGTHLVKAHIIAVLKESIQLHYPEAEPKNNIIVDPRKAG